MIETAWLFAFLALAAAEPEEQTLAQVVAERPFPEYAKWWPVKEEFARFMSDAIVSEWSALSGNDGGLEAVAAYASEYVKTVYGREARSGLVDDFVAKRFAGPLQSGEFDALSYAFFRSAFELLAAHASRDRASLEAERRLFARRVGKKFFAAVERTLNLEIPVSLDDEVSFTAFRRCIDRIGAFLLDQGYYGKHVAFRFEVDVEHQGRRIQQAESDVVDRLAAGGSAYALFEMGYPIILPSAVYLFHTLGEAQHHSSRTMEELFDRVGLSAGETADFDPIGFPSDRVVELWEIRRK